MSLRFNVLKGDMLQIKRYLEFLSLGATRKRRLRTNFLWNAAGNGVFALSQWGILIIFAKLGSPTLVGLLVYGVALTTPLYVIASLQLRTIQATDADHRHTLGQYLGLRALTTFGALLVAVGMAAAMWRAGSLSALIILLWALAKAVDSGSDTLYGLFQQSERMDYVGLSLILRSILAIVCVALLFRATHSAPLALGGLMVGWSAALIFFDMPVARMLLRLPERTSSLHGAMGEALRPVFSWRQLMPLCLEAAPLGTVIFLLAIQLQIPRYVVVGMLHTHELGLFSAASYLTFIGTMLVYALGAPACVRLAQLHVSGELSAFRQLMAKLLLVAVALGMFGVLVSAVAGGRILALLYTAEYSRMGGVLTMLCAASGLSYVGSFLGYGMTSLHRYSIQIPIFVGVVLITILGCYWLTGLYGLMGTAAGMLIGNLAQVLMSAAVVWHATQRNRMQTIAESCALTETAKSLS